MRTRLTTVELLLVKDIYLGRKNFPLDELYRGIILAVPFSGHTRGNAFFFCAKKLQQGRRPTTYYSHGKLVTKQYWLIRHP